jgi:hypothetical protein
MALYGEFVLEEATNLSYNTPSNECLCDSTV